jgi:hypothetical protein
MPHLIDHTPFSEKPCEVFVRNERVRIRANQIILWVTLNQQRVRAVDPLATPFPAILDTGYNHTFSIHERHLTEWAGLQPESLVSLGTIRDRGQRIPLRAVSVWVHPNKRGFLDTLASIQPLHLKRMQVLRSIRAVISPAFQS